MNDTSAENNLTMYLKIIDYKRSIGITQWTVLSIFLTVSEAILVFGLSQRDRWSSIGKPEELRNHKLITIKSEKNQALLGAAILGFDYYIQEEKIRELQELAKKTEGKIKTFEGIRFLKESEALRFMKTNAGQLKITVDDKGEFFKLYKY